MTRAAKLRHWSKLRKRHAHARHGMKRKSLAELQKFVTDMLREEVGT